MDVWKVFVSPMRADNPAWKSEIVPAENLAFAANLLESFPEDFAVQGLGDSELGNVGTEARPIDSLIKIESMGLIKCFETSHVEEVFLTFFQNQAMNL